MRRTFYLFKKIEFANLCAANKNLELYTATQSEANVFNREMIQIRNVNLVIIKQTVRLDIKLHSRLKSKLDKTDTFKELANACTLHTW